MQATNSNQVPKMVYVTILDGFNECTPKKTDEDEHKNYSVIWSVASNNVHQVPFHSFVVFVILLLSSQLGVFLLLLHTRCTQSLMIMMQNEMSINFQSYFINFISTTAKYTNSAYKTRNWMPKLMLQQVIFVEIVYN